DGEAVTI
ncbi:unnamed protein product, partial [Adineta steineri]